MLAFVFMLIFCFINAFTVSGQTVPDDEAKKFLLENEVEVLNGGTIVGSLQADLNKIVRLKNRTLCPIIVIDGVAIIPGFDYVGAQFFILRLVNNPCLESYIKENLGNTGFRLSDDGKEWKIRWYQ